MDPLFGTEPGREYIYQLFSSGDDGRHQITEFAGAYFHEMSQLSKQLTEPNRAEFYSFENHCFVDTKQSECVLAINVEDRCKYDQVIFLVDQLSKNLFSTDDKQQEAQAFLKGLVVESRGLFGSKFSNQGLNDFLNRLKSKETFVELMNQEIAELHVLVQEERKKTSAIQFTFEKRGYYAYSESVNYLNYLEKTVKMVQWKIQKGGSLAATQGRKDIVRVLERLKEAVTIETGLTEVDLGPLGADERAWRNWFNDSDEIPMINECISCLKEIAAQQQQKAELLENVRTLEGKIRERECYRETSASSSQHPEPLEKTAPPLPVAGNRDVLFADVTYLEDGQSFDVGKGFNVVGEGVSHQNNHKEYTLNTYERTFSPLERFSNFFRFLCSIVFPGPFSDDPVRTTFKSVYPGKIIRKIADPVIE